MLEKDPAEPRLVSKEVRILQISADRSARGLLHRDSPAFKRQEAYARVFGNLDVIAFSLRSDEVQAIDAGSLRIFPTNALSKFLYGWYALRMARAISKPDVVTVQDPFETGLTGWCIAKRNGVPLHAQVHTDFLSPAYRRHSLINRVRVRLALFVLRRATRIRVVSHWIKSDLEKSGISAPITVLPIYADLAHIREGGHPALTSRFHGFEKRVVVVSRLEKEKDVALAIRSFQEVSPLGSCLIIVGEGSERRSLETLARDLRVETRVFFEGEQDAANYYALADLVLVPSRYEGYGLVIIEALAAGKPVISTDVGVAREAGAIIASSREFSQALARWFEGGPREGVLSNYPYRHFEEYAHAYCADIAEAAGYSTAANK